MASGDDVAAKYVITVQLADMLQYAAGGTRLLVEGERVYRANHLLLVGIQNVLPDGFQVFATCLKSSAPKSDPHKITIRTKASFEKWTLECTCKAGLGKCKHVMAVLNHLMLSPSVPTLTVTDVQQRWGKIAEKVANDLYHATPLKDFCRTGVTLDRSYEPLTSVQSSSILNSFLQAFPSSSIAYEINGRPKIREIVEDDSLNCSMLSDFLELNIRNRTESIDSLISVEEDPVRCELKLFLETAFEPNRFSLIDKLNSIFIGPLEQNLEVYYEVHVCVSEHESISICCDTIEQRLSATWKNERCLRITASNAYSLHTYYSRPKQNKNWKRKVLRLIKPKSIKSSAISHGIRCEPFAIKAYERDFDKKVFPCGFVVPPHMPWLGCSPDGIILEERKIIEVKCPEMGKDNPIKLIIETLPFLTKNTKTLKKKHQYYAQVQMNMFVLKCKEADFIVYSEFEDKCHVCTIQFDEEFVYDMINSLREVYFNAFLKYLYAEKK